MGKPRVTAIMVNKPLNSIYISDNLAFTIKGADENDYIDSILVSWNGDTLFDVRAKAAGDSGVVPHTFARSDSGMKTIVVRVKDIDGLVKDSTLTLTVLSGAPLIDSIAVPATVWVNDTNDVIISYSDVNGYIIKHWVDWDTTDGIEWEDSSTTTNVFPHWWDATFGGNFATFKVKVMDDAC